MRQILLFVYHVLIFNVIKPLPYSSNYYKNHFQLSTQNFSDYDLHYKEIVKFGKKQSGWVGILLANIVLLFFCLPLCFSADWIIHGVHLFSIKTIVNAILALMMLGSLICFAFVASEIT